MRKKRESFSFLQERDAKTKEAYSFLQTKFIDLKKEERDEFLETAWREYKITKRTNLLESYVTGFLFAQLSAKKGIEKYGELAEAALLAEFQQLWEYDTFHGVNADDLTAEEKRTAGKPINLVEEKTNRGHTDDNPVLKGRSVFNGKVQQGLYPKEETASPTVSQDAFFLTSMVDAAEGRHVAITDVKGAYLNAHMKDRVVMKIVGAEVELFVKIDPTLGEYVTVEKGKKTLYVILDRALYGCVQSALLRYELYSTTLQDMGFELNPYDMCVANAMIDGSQCTVCWYVDDNKISHLKEKVVDDIIEKKESKFGKMFKTKGEKHDFLGMTILAKKGKLTVDMKKLVMKAIADFAEDITRDAATPAKHYLFEVREEAKPLQKDKAENFHSVSALLLFISRRCRLDIQTAVGFLTTRVSCPDEDDWMKLKRVLQYLRGTLDLKLTLGADDITKMKSYVDASFGVHSDCRSHTGGCITFGWGVLMTKCQKQKLNTRSSTEAEVVGVSDFMPNMIWGRMFLEQQGITLRTNVLYQDNESAMKLEKNGRMSSGQRTKHMANRYFWIKDRLASEKIDLQHCPTGKMIADFFTKPLQGSLFRKFRDIVLGYKHVSSLSEEEPLAQERVLEKISRRRTMVVLMAVRPPTRE